MINSIFKNHEQRNDEGHMKWNKQAEVSTGQQIKLDAAETSCWIDYTQITTFVSEFFMSNKKQISTDVSDMETAVSACCAEDEKQALEIETINTLLYQYTQELRLLTKNYISQVEMQPYGSNHSLFQVTTLKKHFSVESRQHNVRTDLVIQLHELMNTYPKWLSTGKVTVEMIESHTSAKKEHHQKVLDIAVNLFSELPSLLTQAFLIHNQ